ncbi:MAG: hypothetical protein EOM02_12615 [Synergistales bacterium]|nr:hypothetical protein [Dethiosulfovibrio sp.]NCC97662.1 hypothetical protein [Synergistales bacterium]
MDKDGPLKDIVLFGKIISIALLFCGYILMGLYIGKEMELKGGASWFTSAGAVLGTLLGGLHSTWAIRDILKKRDKKFPGK